MPTLIPIDEAQAPFYAGVDVGGTNIKIGLVDDLGKTVAFSSVPTEDETGPQDGMDRITAAIQSMMSNVGADAESLVAVGLGTPGSMDIPAGLILVPHNLPGWRNFPIRDALSKTCGRPVAYLNDANAAAYGEYWVGSGREYNSMIMLTLGTGVGGGIIIGDLSIDGENSHGSECGHIIIDSRDDARTCPCGKRGHLEAYASATALVQRTNEALATGKDSSITGRLQAGETLTPLMLAREADAGDPLSLDLILETAVYLGVGITTLLHTIDPNVVVLGGAMNFGGGESDLGRKFLDRIRREVKERAFPVLADKIDIRFASLGGDAGYLGAAGTARFVFGATGA